VALGEESEQREILPSLPAQVWTGVLALRQKFYSVVRYSPNQFFRHTVLLLVPER
jgi:hypothetical protein